jgi:predicted nucleotidyltransferase
MPQPVPFERLFELERQLGAWWPQFHSARDRSAACHRELADATAGLPGEDASIVVFGSVGRFEVTSDSDIDWTYLIDGQASLQHQVTAHKVQDRIESVKRKKPGPEGTFGSLAFSHELVHHIGGRDDTNANLTRRILLLLESRPIGRRDAYDRVVRMVLERYLTGDYGWMRARTPHGIPRFLQNDIARYWRTVAVDFAYKQWTRDGKGSALKSAKLRLSRKLIYAAGLVYCFSPALLSWSVEKGTGQSERKMLGIEHLSALTAWTPLDLLADAFMASPSLAESAKAAFGTYEEFLGMLNDANARRHLESLTPEAADSDPLWSRVRALGRQFQDGLDALFLHDPGTRYPELVKAYGVF